MDVPNHSTRIESGPASERVRAKGPRQGAQRRQEGAQETREGGTGGNQEDGGGGKGTVVIVAPGCKQDGIGVVKPASSHETRIRIFRIYSGCFFHART